MSCLKCEFFHSDSYSEGFWYICTHEKFGSDGEILPTKDGVTPEWCPLGLAIKDIELSKTTRPLFFCALHQLESFIKMGYRAEEAQAEITARLTQRAPDAGNVPPQKSMFD
jgi:hypothetical protein